MSSVQLLRTYGTQVKKGTEYNFSCFTKNRSNWNIKGTELGEFISQYCESVQDALENAIEDYTILDTHYILTGKGNKIFAHTLDAKNKDWVLIEDMSQFIDGDIERIVLNPVYKKIAVVVKHTP